MGRPHYVCSSCKHNFTRIWNANRHIINQHQSLAEIIPIGDFLLEQKSHLDEYFRYPSLSPKSYQQLPNQNSNISTYPDEDDRQVILLDNTLAKLAPYVEELGQLLLQQYPPESMQKIQGTYIMTALSSRDPIRHMDQLVKSLRRGRTSGMMIHKVAESQGVSFIQAEKILLQLLSRSQRNRINRIVKSDHYQIYQRDLGYHTHEFQSMQYNYHRQTTFTSKWFNEGFRNFF